MKLYNMCVYKEYTLDINISNFNEISPLISDVPHKGLFLTVGTTHWL